MKTIITREQLITATVNAWLEAGVIRWDGDEAEQAVLALNRLDTETILHVMLTASQMRPGNMELLEEVEPAFNFSMN